MKQPVMLSIRAKQCYIEQDPDIIEFVTEGTFEQLPDGWEIVYNESSLTGMDGVTTCFQIKPDCVVLTRSGALNSQMIFRLGQVHESLYQMEFGALLMSVCATKIASALNTHGGTVDLVYNIEIEQSTAGSVEYHMELKTL